MRVLPSVGVRSPEPGTEPAPLLPLQTYTAVYYVLADLVMLSLYFHYKFKNRPSPCEYGGPSVSGTLGAAGSVRGSSCPIAG